MTRIAVIVASADPATVAEAWRAALGLTLRGAAVTVATVAGSADGGPAAARARATLALFGHAVDGDAAVIDAEVIERWGELASVDAPRAQPVVHLVRPGRAPGAVAPGDRVLQLGADVDADLVLDALAALPVRVW